MPIKLTPFTNGTLRSSSLTGKVWTNLLNKKSGMEEPLLHLLPKKSSNKTIKTLFSSPMARLVIMMLGVVIKYSKNINSPKQYALSSAPIGLRSICQSPVPLPEIVKTKSLKRPQTLLLKSSFNILLKITRSLTLSILSLLRTLLCSTT